jgi:hypothetical protein
MSDWHQRTAVGAVAASPVVAYGLNFWGFRPAVLMYLLLILALLLNIGTGMGDDE